MTNPFFTIGHSTHPISEFVALFQEAEIQLVVDVRTVPRSRTNPQYDRSVLPKTLREFQIEYEHLLELGGLRSKSAHVAPAVNALEPITGPEDESPNHIRTMRHTIDCVLAELMALPRSRTMYC
jgi:hypothetical protein